MSRDYSPMHFYLRVPNALLARFFQQHHRVLADLDFTQLDESRDAAETVHRAVTALPDAEQSSIEAECREVEGMATYGGITALIDEATHHPHFDSAFPSAINQVDGEYGKAMWTYLEHREYWDPAMALLHADSIADAFWRRRNDIPNLTPLVERDDAERLASELKQYFQAKEGRGRHARVDVFRRDNEEYFFAYLSDFGQSQAEWDAERLWARPRLPAFEIIFVYCQGDGTLDVFALKNSKYVPDLQSIFAAAILQLPNLPPFEAGKGVYPFHKFADRDFTFKYPPESGIESVRIRRLRFSLFGAGKRRVTIQAEGHEKAVYDLMEGLDVPRAHVTQVEISATFSKPLPGTRSRKRTFMLSYPDLCNLQHEGRDKVLREMLATSGIEPCGARGL
jgi:hypothetical protein